MRDIQTLRSLGHAARDLRLREPRHAQRKADILGDRHVRVERVVLEHHGDVAVLRITSFTRAVNEICPPEASSSPATMRRIVDLPQPDGPTSTTNSPSAIVKVHAVNDLDLAEALAHAAKLDLGHASLPSPARCYAWDDIRRKSAAGMVRSPPMTDCIGRRAMNGGDRPEGLRTADRTPQCGACAAPSAPLCSPPRSALPPADALQSGGRLDTAVRAAITVKCQANGRGSPAFRLNFAARSNGGACLKGSAAPTGWQMPGRPASAPGPPRL